MIVPVIIIFTFIMFIIYRVYCRDDVIGEFKLKNIADGELGEIKDNVIDVLIGEVHGDKDDADIIISKSSSVDFGGKRILRVNGYNIYITEDVDIKSIFDYENVTDQMKAVHVIKNGLLLTIIVCDDDTRVDERAYGYRAINNSLVKLGDFYTTNAFIFVNDRDMPEMIGVREYKAVKILGSWDTSVESNKIVLRENIDGMQRQLVFNWEEILKKNFMDDDDDVKGLDIEPSAPMLRQPEIDTCRIFNNDGVFGYHDTALNVVFLKNRKGKLSTIRDTISNLFIRN